MTMGCGSTRQNRTTMIASLVSVMLLGVSTTPAAAQQTTLDVLSFLLTNRTIITGDFDRDAQAAAATRDTIAGFLTQELATIPVSSSSGGFTYRVDSSIGAVVRSSDSFGPFYTERSLTAGRHRASFGVGYQSTLYNTIDGHDLRDGTLVSTAATLGGVPFDVETVSLRIRADLMTLTGNYGLSGQPRSQSGHSLCPGEPSGRARRHVSRPAVLPGDRLGLRVGARRCRRTPQIQRVSHGRERRDHRRRYSPSNRRRRESAGRGRRQLHTSLDRLGRGQSSSDSMGSCRTR